MLNFTNSYVKNSIQIVNKKRDVLAPNREY